MKLDKVLSVSGLIRRALISAILATGLTALPATAQQTRVQQAQKKVADLLALYSAEDHKSPVCKGYIGKVVTPSSFGALALRLSGPAAKGEFETTAQYNARLAATRSAPPTTPVILALPTDRDFINYTADDKLMTIQAGAFGAGKFSDIVDVQVTADNFGMVPEGIEPGTQVPHSQSERLLRTYTARNDFGTTAKVSEIERRSNGLYLAAPRLFAYAKDDESPVMFFQTPVAQAQRIKQTLRVALALVPKAPYVFRVEQPGAAPTLRTPIQYEDKLTAIYADAKCALALDGQGRVLAATDAAS